MHTELNAIIANERIAERIAEARRWSLLPKQGWPGVNGTRILTPWRQRRIPAIVATR
jgi:hypothetical protein